MLLHRLLSQLLLKESLFSFQAEDLVANFFPKKLLELDAFLKVSYKV